MGAVPTNQRRRLQRAGLAATLTLGLVLGFPATSHASHQHGYNVCLNQGHTVYKSANSRSGTVGWVSRHNVWHHYDTEGNWSLGYVRGNPSIKGYIPKGTFDHKTGHNALRCD